MRRHKSEYEIGEDNYKLLVASQEREMFLLLFYRERVCRLASRLRLQSDHQEALRRRHRKNQHAAWDASIAQVSEWLAQFVARAEDETRCNDICKSMYFCDLKKGHKGPHGEWCGREPHPRKVGGPGWLVWPQERRRAA